MCVILNNIIGICLVMGLDYTMYVIAIKIGNKFLKLMPQKTVIPKNSSFAGHCLNALLHFIYRAFAHLRKNRHLYNIIIRSLLQSTYKLHIIIYLLQSKIVFIIILYIITNNTNINTLILNLPIHV